MNMHQGTKWSVDRRCDAECDMMHCGRGSCARGACEPPHGGRSTCEPTAKLRGCSVWVLGGVAHAATCKRMARPWQWASMQQPTRAALPPRRVAVVQPSRPAKLAASSKQLKGQSLGLRHTAWRKLWRAAWEGAVREARKRQRRQMPRTAAAPTVDAPRHCVGGGQCSGGAAGIGWGLGF